MARTSSGVAEGPVRVSAGAAGAEGAAAVAESAAPWGLSAPSTFSRGLAVGAAAPENSEASMVQSF